MESVNKFNLVHKKNIEYINIESTDYSLVYYAFDLYTKCNCLYKYYSNNENNFEANEIIYGLYIGNLNSVYDINGLKNEGITEIISVIAGFEPPYPNDFNYLIINALDNENTNLMKSFEKTNEFIQKAFYENKKVLIHCQAGRSRSATILAAYLIKTFGMNSKTVLEIIKSKRSIIQPNKYFSKQLEEYYNYLIPKYDEIDE